MRNVETFNGKLTDCPTTVIVNSSNTDIALGSGVSNDIRNACGGINFQTELTEIRESLEGEILSQGQVVVSGGGTSSYRWIFHAAVMDFRKSHATSYPVVRACMLNVLKAAEELIEEEDLDELSIGVPLCGSNVGRLSIYESCNAICEAIKSHFPRHRDSKISAILFAHPDPEVCKKVQMILGNHFVLK